MSVESFAVNIFPIREGVRAAHVVGPLFLINVISRGICRRLVVFGGCLFGVAK